MADLIRRIKHGEPWPDGTPIELPNDSKTLMVMSDNHHDEMVDLARAFGIDDCIYLNAEKDAPREGTTLETADDLAKLGQRIDTVKPIFVIVDTIGNCTSLNLCKPEDAKTFFSGLQVIAAKHDVAVICVTHLNATGGVLGRRALEKVRSAIRLTQPDPTGQPDRRWLGIIKSNVKSPPPLGVTMTATGNEYDDDPPSAPGDEPGQRGRPAAKRDACADWLRDQLADGPRLLGELRAKGELAGYTAPRLYGARASIGVVETKVGTRKWWSLAGHAANPHDGDRSVFDDEVDE
jgi:hypothetical protein